MTKFRHRNGLCVFVSGVIRQLWHVQECPDVDADLATVKSEIVDREIRADDDYNSADELSREESSREMTPSFYENLESDETEEEGSDISRRKLVNLNSDKPASNQLLKSDTSEYY